jgi:hypothetical protein
MPIGPLSSSRVARVAVLVGLALVGTSCTNPEREAQLLSEISAMGDALNDTRSYVADLESRVDSLVRVLSRQDTALVRLSEFTGVQIPRGGQ